LHLQVIYVNYSHLDLGWGLRLKKAKITVFVNIVLTLFACIAMCMWYRHSYLLSAICQEDGFVENTQAILYGLAGLGFILIYVKKSKNWWHLALSLLFLALAGEEISWGQRVFGFASTAWELKNNVQNEDNFHNIDGIHQHIRLIAAIFILVYFILMPILNRYFVGIRSFLNQIKLPIYPIWGQVVLIIALIIMTFVRVHYINYYQVVDEIGELYIALGTFFIK
jgi:hypothetical protein